MQRKPLPAWFERTSFRTHALWFRRRSELLDASDAGEALEHLRPNRGRYDCVMRRARGQPCGRGGGEVGLGPPDGTADRQVRQPRAGFDDLGGVGSEPQHLARQRR